MHLSQQSEESDTLKGNKLQNHPKLNAEAHKLYREPASKYIMTMSVLIKGTL